MNLANLGLSGLTAAQVRLQTAGHNIDNAATDGYNRQSVQVSTAGAGSTGSGYVGWGVQVDSVTRSYDGFLYKQLVDSQSTGAALASYGNQITQVSNLFADPTVGISPAIQNFFDSVQAVASAPADSAARQQMLGQAGSLVTSINSANAFLDDQRNNVNTQITTTVDQINSYVQRIQNLNVQITNAMASSSGQPPNDLLDQRDQAVADLNQLANVKVLNQDDGSFSLTIGNGQLLLGGNTVFPLKAVPSAADPSRTVVAYSVPSGAGGAMSTAEMPEQAITGGSLGGLLSYRSQVLDTVQDSLGQLAAGLAMNVNALQEQGVDLNGNAGQEFFSLGTPKVLANTNNGGGAEISASFSTPADSNALTGQDYKVQFDGTNYHVYSLPDGTELGSGSPEPDGIPGVSMTLSGTPAAGDSWLVEPTRTTASSLTLEISDPAKIAAADSSGGSANGNVALQMAQLQGGKVLGGGTMSLNEAYSQIVNRVGVLTQQNSAAATAQNTLIQQNYAAQQAVSGVNLNEEYVNLDNYQEQFRAASRLIDVSSQLFDTLLSMGT